MEEIQYRMKYLFFKQKLENFILAIEIDYNKK